MKKSDYSQGNGTKSRISREHCDLVQSLDHFSKISFLVKQCLTSLRYSLVADLLEELGCTACLPVCLLAYSNELILLTQLCLSSLRYNSLQWFSGCHRAAFRYIKHNVLNSNMGEQCELLAGLFVFQSHSVLDSYNIQREAGLDFYNHRII